jgi:hypothetical protein
MYRVVVLRCDRALRPDWLGAHRCVSLGRLAAGNAYGSIMGETVAPLGDPGATRADRGVEAALR